MRRKQEAKILAYSSKSVHESLRYGTLTFCNNINLPLPESNTFCIDLIMKLANDCLLTMSNWSSEEGLDELSISTMKYLEEQLFWAVQSDGKYVKYLTHEGRQYYETVLNQIVETIENLVSTVIVNDTWDVWDLVREGNMIYFINKGDYRAIHWDEMAKITGWVPL